MVQGLNTGYNQYQIQQVQTVPPAQNKNAQNITASNTQINRTNPALYSAPYMQNVPVQGYQMYAVPPKNVYIEGITPSKTQTPQIPEAAPLSNIPIQPDVLSLNTQYSKDKEINLQDPAKNMQQSPVDTSLNAQMPAPNIKTEQTAQQTTVQTENDTAQTDDSSKEKILPSLNIGVVDAPNNVSLTPITDDLNSRAQDIERTYLPNAVKPASSPAPQTLGKKPFSAGKMSAYLMFGSLGIASFMIIPKGISKIAKLIKHK